VFAELRNPKRSGKSSPPGRALRIRRGVVTLLLGTSLVGCSAFNKTGGTVSDACSASAQLEQTFSTTLYPILTQTCANCHTPQKGQNPEFMLGDAASTYAQVRPLLDNLADPLNSTLAVQGMKGHCQTSACENPPGFETALVTWATAEASPAAQSCAANNGSDSGLGGSTASYVSLGQQTIEPNGPLSTTKATTFSYSLAPFGAAGAGATLVISLERDAEATISVAYLITNMTVISPSGVHITNIRLTVVNGATTFVNNTYTVVNANVAADSTAPGTQVPTTGTKFVGDTLLQQGPSGDQLLVEVSAVGPYSNVTSTTFTQSTCTALTTSQAPSNSFTSNVLPLVQNTCITCHASGGAGASQFLMNPSVPASLCEGFKSRMFKSDLAISDPVQNPAGMNGHPTVSGYSIANQGQLIINWAAQEQ
jgi:hypothetical protein